VKASLLAVLMIAAQALAAQTVPEGVLKGYEGEWSHVSEQLIALAEATPAEKFAWRPAPGVRSTSEVYMHIVREFLPAELHRAEDARRHERGHEQIRHLEGRGHRLAEAVARSRQDRPRRGDAQRPGRKVKTFAGDATVDAVYLRIIIHANEHMGQLVAYARMSGVVPPWSKP